MPGRRLARAVASTYVANHSICLTSLNLSRRLAAISVGLEGAAPPPPPPWRRQGRGRRRGMTAASARAACGRAGGPELLCEYSGQSLSRPQQQQQQRVRNPLEAASRRLLCTYAKTNAPHFHNHRLSIRLCQANILHCCSRAAKSKRDRPSLSALIRA